MLDRAPAVDLPEHRAEPRVGAVEPVAQRLHRADGQAGTAANDNGVHAVRTRGACMKFGRRRGEADMLDIEADQRGAAETAGRRGVALRRALCRIAVTTGSAAGETRPLWRCFAAIAAARRDQRSAQVGPDRSTSPRTPPNRPRRAAASRGWRAAGTVPVQCRPADPRLTMRERPSTRGRGLFLGRLPSSGFFRSPRWQATRRPSPPLCLLSSARLRSAVLRLPA